MARVERQEVDRTPRKCKHCPDEFIPTTKIQIFCGKKCREGNWREVNRDYCNNHTRNYRRRRYERDGYWRDDGPLARGLKEWMIELKAKPCSDCGNTFPTCCMDHDHRAGTEKLYNVGSMFAHHYSRELIETELAKCDLVCSNCHRVRTRDRLTGTGNRAYRPRVKPEPGALVTQKRIKKSLTNPNLNKDQMK